MEINSKRRTSVFGQLLLGLVMVLIGALCFALGISYSIKGANASETKKPRVIYPKHTELDFEGTRIEGEIRNPGEFYFMARSEEKFDSLVKRRPNFHREMLRDAVLGK